MIVRVTAGAAVADKTFKAVLEPASWNVIRLMPSGE
jgi:hypothetical protein